LLDFSHRPELAIHAEVLRDVHAAADPLGLSPLIVGAFARDLLLTHAHGIGGQRATQDVDLALAVPGWDRFEQLRARLLDGGRFAITDQPHRLRHRAMPVDLVPFGSIETPERQIAWPPAGSVTMDAFGFEEARLAAVSLMLPLSVHTAIASLPGLALLKLVCWNDRHTRSPIKDAVDLDFIIANYLAAGNEERLWGEFVSWTQEDGFDWEMAGARMLAACRTEQFSSTEENCSSVWIHLDTRISVIEWWSWPLRLPAMRTSA